MFASTHTAVQFEVMWSDPPTPATHTPLSGCCCTTAMIHSLQPALKQHTTGAALRANNTACCHTRRPSARHSPHKHTTNTLCTCTCATALTPAGSGVYTVLCTPPPARPPCILNAVQRRHIHTEGPTQPELCVSTALHSKNNSLTLQTSKQGMNQHTDCTAVRLFVCVCER